MGKITAEETVAQLTGLLAEHETICETQGEAQ